MTCQIHNLTTCEPQYDAVRAMPGGFPNLEAAREFLALRYAYWAMSGQAQSLVWDDDTHATVTLTHGSQVRYHIRQIADKA